MLRKTLCTSFQPTRKHVPRTLRAQKSGTFGLAMRHRRLPAMKLILEVSAQKQHREKILASKQVYLMNTVLQ